MSFNVAEEFFDVLYEENIEKLRFLAKNIDFSKYSEELEESLVGFSEEGNIEMVQFLIELGAKDSENRAIYFACSEKHHDVVLFLLAHGSTIDIDVYKNTLME